jgi:exosome complex component RRP40
MEPELECVDATTGKSEGFGELKGGLMITTSLEFARQYVYPPAATLCDQLINVVSTGQALIDRLLMPKHPLLRLISDQYPFEVAVGMNGRVWFKAEAVDQTIALKRVLEAAERGQLEYDAKAVSQLIKSMT